MPTIAEIAAKLGAPVRGDASRLITGVAGLDDAGAGDISVLSNKSWLPQFAATAAAAGIVEQGIKLPNNTKAAILTVEDADAAIARVLEMFAPPVPRPAVGIDPSAKVSPTAKIGQGCAIGPNVNIGERSRL